MKYSIKNKSDKEIVLILENKDDWTPKLINLAKAELRQRSLNIGDFKKHINLSYRKKCQELIVKSEFSADNYSLPSSNFLNKEERHYLFMDELEEYMIRRSDMYRNLKDYRG